MKEMYLESEEDFIYELEAFLVKLRGVPDVLLEDFNREFSLGISLEEELKPGVFEKRAKRLRNREAIEFIQWWKRKMDFMRHDKIGALLFRKRNIAAHRKVVRPDLKKISLSVTIHLTDSLTVRKYDAEGNLIEEIKSPETQLEPTKPKQSAIRVEWCFKDYPDEDILQICEKLFHMVKEFVEEAKERFS